VELFKVKRAGQIQYMSKSQMSKQTFTRSFSQS